MFMEIRLFAWQKARPFLELEYCVSIPSSNVKLDTEITGAEDAFSHSVVYEWLVFNVLSCKYGRFVCSDDFNIDMEIHGFGNLPLEYIFAIGFPYVYHGVQYL